MRVRKTGHLWPVSHQDTPLRAGVFHVKRGPGHKIRLRLEIGQQPPMLHRRQANGAQPLPARQRADFGGGDESQGGFRIHEHSSNTVWRQSDHPQGTGVA